MAFSKRFGAFLLSSAAVAVLATTPARADAIADHLAALQQQIDDLNNTVADLKRAQSAQYADVQNQRAQDVQVSIKNGRPTFKTSDGSLSIAIRAVLQFDSAYYSGGRGPIPANDFSSGTNFRRARLGISGTLFTDWSYEFLYDLGGSGTEGSTVSSAYVQYDGIAPFHFRIGAFPTPESFDDSTSASDLLFLERSQPTDLGRSVAGSDGREGASIFAYDDDYFAALSYTTNLVGAAADFDEQQALVGRAAYRFVAGTDVNFAIGADSTYVVKLPDLAAGPGSAHALRLRERPELNVDSNSIRLIDTNNIDASHYWEWGVEAAGNWYNLYGQGGYFSYDVTRRASLLPNPSFNGWYAQASWVLTGESKPYKPERGAYGSPVPNANFEFDGEGWGAWELAARYSDLNLNFNQGLAGFATPVGGIRGGDQRIWTVGLNFYPNPALRFVLDYQHTDVSKLSGAGASLNTQLDALSLRTQIAL